MTTVEQLRENIAAAVDRQKLGALEQDALRRYAHATNPFACGGCDHICGAAVAAPVRIGTTMRSLMYHDSYGDAEKARRVFRELPPEARSFAEVDFSGANRACPRGIDVAAQMKRAAKLLA
jgi:hypothetical protein